MPTAQEAAQVPFEPAKKVLADDTPLAEYTRAQPAPKSRARTTMEIPIMRNRPFGDSLGGGETPFFMDSGPTASPARDDGHDGIPTGLPAALGRLDELSVDSSPAAAGPTSSASASDADGLALRLAETEAKLARAKAVIPLTMAIGTLTGGSVAAIVTYMSFAG